MNERPLPVVGVPEIDAGHRKDEERGLGQSILRHLESLGYSGVFHMHSGYKARLYSALGPDGKKVAIRVQAPFALAHRREKQTLVNYLLMRATTGLMPRHPNLVSYRSAGVLRFKDANGEPLKLYCVIMDYIEGKTLQDSLQDDAYRAGGVPRISEMLTGILHGWCAIHRRGLRQGDIYPANIILERDSFRPILVDLRFSIRYFRPLRHESRKFRCTVRAILTGVYDNTKGEYPALPFESVERYWKPRNAAENDRLQHWMAFEVSLGEGRALFQAHPPVLLQEVQRFV